MLKGTLRESKSLRFPPNLVFLSSALIFAVMDTIRRYLQTFARSPEWVIDLVDCETHILLLCCVDFEISVLAMSKPT